VLLFVVSSVATVGAGWARAPAVWGHGIRADHAKFFWWCIKLWDITSLGSVQVVGFFDVAALVCAGDGPIAALMGVYSGIFCISFTKELVHATRFTNGLVYR